ncbi:MAG: DUF4147 domain-containing protein, partial [Anaerolineae bacterium]|nr:DUF4147 domain-containing protein [Anaerolineae bacterium]
VGAGKASAPMAAAVSEIFGDRIAAGHVIVKYGYTTEGVHPNIVIHEAGHPIPDRAGWHAAQQLRDLLSQTGADDVVVCLISGGGSALLTLPAGDISLEDLQETTKQLLSVGATINQVNTIRKHVSQIKGGQLASVAFPARVHALILSDVVADPLPIIASGPTVPDPSTFSQAWQILEQFHLVDKIPRPVVQWLSSGREGRIPETPTAEAPVFQQTFNTIIGSNRIAAKAAVEAARQAGFESELLSTFIEGEAREVGKIVAGLAKGLASDESSLTRPACWVLGGETTVTLRGTGKGGRNQEMALAAALGIAGWPRLLIACLGTDGTDGPTDAAGAFADGETVASAKAVGLNAVNYLNNNDAYSFFEAISGLIKTGPTNTNVNDITLIFAA